MMEIIRERHSGSIPLDMIVHIWRDIISTFTYLQANYSVHLTNEGDVNIVRNMARFQFGFTVPFESHSSTVDALSTVAKDGNALTVLPITKGNCWWQHLNSADGLAIMTRLPVATTALPCCDAFVISPPIADPVPFDFRAYAGTIKSADALDDWTGGEVIAVETDDNGKLQALMSIASGNTAPKDLLDIRAVGGYFAKATVE